MFLIKLLILCRAQTYIFSSRPREGSYGVGVRYVRPSVRPAHLSRLDYLRERLGGFEPNFTSALWIDIVSD
jgi:hypothetical protein